VAPRSLHERVTLQQGVFLCPGDVECPFEDNLAAVLARPRSGAPPLVQFVIQDKDDLRDEIRRRLDRMNVSEAVLFPGLDGFARSLDRYLVNADLFMRSTETREFEGRLPPQRLAGRPQNRR
jgi:hypothetical protein